MAIDGRALVSAQHGDRKVVGRLAPSPTGAQHLGNARTFLMAWASVRKASGQLLLRIEDLDTPRTKPGAAEQAVEDLRWLGLDWDASPGDERELPPLVQTQRLDRYYEILESLKSLEMVYPCTCTRSDVEQAQSAPHEMLHGIEAPSPMTSLTQEPRYPGTCSHRTVDSAKDLERAKVPFAWRFRMPDRTVSWEDRFWGKQSLNPAQALGDFVIARANGMPAYQLAVVVDDHDMEVTEIVRGDDLIPSTYRQLAIYQTLTWSSPSMLHLPLVVGPDGRRLAKRHGDTRLASLRQAGIRAETLLGYFALANGWSTHFRPLNIGEFYELVDFETIPKSPLRFEAADAVGFFRQLQSSSR